MVIHKTHLRLGRTKMISEPLKAATLVGQAGIRARHIEEIVIVEWELTFGETFQVTQQHSMGRRPARADCVELIGPHAGKIEAGANGVVRKAGVVLDPADALLRDGKKEFAVPGDTRGGVMHLRIIKSDGNHWAFFFDFSPQHHVIGVSSPVISSSAAPAVSMVLRTSLASSEAPRQLLPAMSGGSPNKAAIPRLACRNPSDHGKSTILHARRPFQFIVILGMELN